MWRLDTFKRDNQIFFFLFLNENMFWALIGIPTNVFL